MKKRTRAAIALMLLGCPGILWAQRKLALEELFELAEQNSKQIHAAQIAHQTSLQAVKVAKDARLPSIEGSLSVSYLGEGWMADRNFANGMHAPMPHFGNNFAIEASQVLYAGGVLSTAITRAELQTQIASLDVEQNRQEVRFLITGNYLEIYKLSNQEVIYQQNIEQTRALLDEMRAKEQEGVVLPNDITRYELQLQSLELSLIQLRNSRIIINHQLTTVVGLDGQELIEPQSRIIEQLPEITAEELWQQRANEQSPLLKLAEERIRLAQQNEKQIRAERLPSVALFAGDRLDGPIIIEVPPINKNFNYWYVGLGVQFNIASLYKTRRKSNLATLKTAQAEQAYALTEQQIENEVKAAYVRFDESFSILETQLKNLKLANENYEVVNNRYLNDLAVLTDMLDASNTQLSAQLQVVNARINILFQYYKLKKTIGNL